MEVVNLISSTLDSANSLIDIIELSLGALGAVVVDKVESRFTDTSVQDEIFIDGADGNTFSLTSMT